MIRLINNLKFREKGIVIVAVCLLLPLILTNIFFFWSIDREGKRQSLSEMENNGNQIEFEMQNSLREILSIADYLKRLEALNDFLDKEYMNDADYYSAYNKLLENNTIQYYYTAQSAWEIKIFTENETIVNGTYFINKDIVSEQKWFRNFMDSGREYSVEYFYENGESGGYIKRGRHIVVIEKLDYFGRHDVIMLDMDYSGLQKNIKRICGEKDFYIYDNANCLIMSGKNDDSRDKDFEKFIGKDSGRTSYYRSYDIYGVETNLKIEDNESRWSALKGEKKFTLIAIYIFDMLLPLAVLYLIYRSMNDRLSALAKNIEKIKSGKYEIIEIEESKDELGDVVQSYNLMVETIGDLIETVYKNKEREQELSIAKKQAEIHALQSQINPHFMFNALESIRMHSLIKGERETEKILESFSLLLRESVQWNSDKVKVSQECRNAERYLEIQKYRFGDRLKYNLKMQDECADIIIPKFSIITFVENACIHGIEKNLEGGSISVIVSRDEEFLYAEIMDNGRGMEEDELEDLRKKIEEADISYVESAEKSIGIVNTVIRLKQIYGEKVMIDVNSSISGGTEVCIVMPL